MTKEWKDAVQGADLKKLASLIDAGVDVNGKDRFGQTALMLAARDGNIDVVRLLVKHDAKLDTTAKYNLSALMLAVVNRHEEIALALARAGASLEIRGTGAPGFHGKTAAELAAESGQNHLAQWLREAY